MPRLAAKSLADELRRRIADGRWADQLPPERDLAREFGVARNTVRRAVGALEEEGRVAREVGRGTFVQTVETDGFAASLGALAGTSPADMMEVRRLLEPAATAYAATSATAAEIAAVRDAHRAAVATEAMPEFEHWDAEFHDRIFASSRNAFLKELHHLMRLIRNQKPWFEMKKRSFSEARRRIYCDEHEAILQALAARDPEGARAAMDAHLATVQHNLLGR